MQKSVIWIEASSPGLFLALATGPMSGEKFPKQAIAHKGRTSIVVSNAV